MALTVKKVARLMSKGAPGLFSDKGGVRGLVLHVGGKGNSSWGLRFQVNGRARYRGLGSTRDFGLQEARERAKAARQKLADKIDPLEARKVERAAQALAAAKAMTFKQCAEAFIAANEGSWKNRK